METASSSVFSRIGGVSILHAIVDRFYDKISADTNVNLFFMDADMEVLRRKMKSFLMMALGGPAEYTGKDMRKAHFHLVAGGLRDSHFDTVVRHLDESLLEFGVDDETRSRISDVVERVRADVLNKPSV